MANPPDTALPAAALAGLLLLGACAHIERPPAANDNHEAVVAVGFEACRDSLELGTSALPRERRFGNEFSVSVWNTKKGRSEPWRADFERVSAHDLVLLQEARLNADALGADYWSATPGFSRGGSATGVATLSRVAPLVRCELTGREPILRTVKGTSITKFAISADTTLVVVNVHAVNFAVGMVRFRQQISEAVAAVSNHDGPLIFSGDFNTWRGARLELVRDMLGSLGAAPVSFEIDERSRVLGRHLDHVFIRDLEVIEATTQRVSTSDHNPMILRFRA